MVENSPTILEVDWLRETLEAYDRGVNPFHEESDARDLLGVLEDGINEQIAEGVEEAENRVALDTASQMRDDTREGLAEWFKTEALGFKLTIQEQEITLTLPEAMLTQITDKVMELME